MEKYLKSIAYFFISKRYDVYFDDNDSLIVNRLICSECGHPWYMDLTECFFCGMINTYIRKCPECEEYYSITGNEGKCRTHTDTKLIYTCNNRDCPSNTEEVLQMTLQGDDKGIFSSGSVFSSPLSYCLDCGNESNEYDTKKIYIENINDELTEIDLALFNNEKNKIIDEESNIFKSSVKEDIFIFRISNEEEILYSTNLIDELNIEDENVTINDFENSINIDLL